MRRFILGCGFTVFSAAVLAAQTPVDRPQSPAQRPSAPEPVTSAAGPQAQATLTGCLYREQDVPGRTPNVAEKAGVLEDYILAEVTPAPAAGGAPRSTSPDVAGTAGAFPTMYKVENIPDDRLRGLVGKRVEVVGRVDAEGGDRSARGDRPTPDGGIGPDQINLPEFEASSIKEVTGSCPAKPSTER